MDLNEYTDNIYDLIVDQIRSVREEKGISRKKISDDLGLNLVTYSDMENKKTRFTVVRLFAVLKYLEIDTFLNSSKDKTTDLVPITDFDTFIERFQEQSKNITELKNINQKLERENVEIKALLHEILRKLDEKS